MARIKTVSRTQTQTELAKLLEVSQSSVAEAKRRQSIPADWYLKLFEKLGVNPDWLKKGNGPVYLRTEAGYVPSDGDGPPIDPGLLGSPLAQSALAPVYAMCGDSTKTGSPAAALQPIGSQFYYNICSILQSHTCFVNLIRIIHFNTINDWFRSSINTIDIEFRITMILRT